MLSILGLGLLIAAAVGFRMWRIYRKIRLSTLLTAFPDREVFLCNITQWLRRYRRMETARGFEFRPAFRQIGAQPIIVELWNAESAKITGPAINLEMLRRRLPGSRWQPYVGPQPWKGWLKAYLIALGCLVAAATVTIGIFMGVDSYPSQHRAPLPPSTTVAMRGSDLRLAVRITAQQAVTGTTTVITVPGQNRELRVQIPAGVRNGTRLRLRGLGRSGTDGGSPGDLYLVVNVH